MITTVFYASYIAIVPLAMSNILAMECVSLMNYAWRHTPSIAVAMVPNAVYHRIQTARCLLDVALLQSNDRISSFQTNADVRAFIVLVHPLKWVYVLYWLRRVPFRQAIQGGNPHQAEIGIPALATTSHQALGNATMKGRWRLWPIILRSDFSCVKNDLNDLCLNRMKCSVVPSRSASWTTCHGKTWTTTSCPALHLTHCIVNMVDSCGCATGRFHASQSIPRQGSGAP